MTDPFAVPAQPTPAPLYGEPVRAARNAAGTAALVLGVVSLLLGALIVLPVAAIVLGVIGMRRASRGEATNRGVALGGVITGAIGLTLGVLLIVGIVRVVTSDEWDRFVACDRTAVTTEQENACVQRLTDELFGEDR